MNAELIKKQTSSIRSTLEEFTSIFEKYASVCEENLVIETPSQAGAVAKIHVELMTAVKKLNSDVYGPVNNIMAQFEQVSTAFSILSKAFVLMRLNEIIYSGCLRVLLEAGVFDELPFDGRGMSSSDLAAKTNMEEALLGMAVLNDITECWVLLTYPCCSPIDACSCPCLFSGEVSTGVQPNRELFEIPAPTFESNVSIRVGSSSKPKSLCFV